MPRPLSRTVRKSPVLQRDLDEAGMAGDRLVHRVVEDFGGQMVQRGFVGAADIHAGPPADRLQPLQNLDVLGGIIVGGDVPGPASPRFTAAALPLADRRPGHRPR